nr:amyloid beta A4 precursor protein-binding family A member 3 [Pogona vitticeps]XP_020636609.1 amyloid beta A4 precursor protein-binding family A member 3 [Pogona vitticeps]
MTDSIPAGVPPESPAGEDPQRPEGGAKVEIRRDPDSPEQLEYPSVYICAQQDPGSPRDTSDGGAAEPRPPQAGADPGEVLEGQSNSVGTAGAGHGDSTEPEDGVAEVWKEDDGVRLRGLLDQLPGFRGGSPTSEDGLLAASDGDEDSSCRGPQERGLLFDTSHGPALLEGAAPWPLHVATGHGLGGASRWLFRPTRGQKSRGLLSAEADREDLASLLRYEGGVPEETGDQTPLARSDAVAGLREPWAAVGATVGNPEALPVSSEPDREGLCRWVEREGLRPEATVSLDLGGGRGGASESDDGAPEPGLSHKEESLQDPAIKDNETMDTDSADTESKSGLSSFPAFKEVPGPCDAEDLLEGVVFGAQYLGSTQLVSERNPPTSVRMAQAQEAVDRIKAPEGESQPMTDVDLFVSTQRIKVLTADSQEAMMDHPLQTISYIADIGNIVVLMARRKLPRRADTPVEKQLYKMICHVFRSSDAQLIAQAIGQAFSVAYQHFLRASGIDPSQLVSRGLSAEDDEDEENALAKVEDLYNGDLAHFCKQESCKEIIIPKQKGEILGVVIVESGWGSILPTVVIANLMHRGAAERSGKLSIGDRIMSINGTSLVGLPLTTCQSIIRDLKNQTEVTLRVVHCPPVTTAIVRRPDPKYPLGFCVENGIICSLMRGGIAERGGIRVGHRIIEINGQSVVAMPHEKIIQILTQAVSEVHIKTMPTSTYRLLTGQEQPAFL